MKPRLIIIAKSVLILIGTILFTAAMAHLFPPKRDGFATINVILVPIVIGALSSILYIIFSLIKPSKEPFLLKTTVITNVLVVLLSIFT